MTTALVTTTFREAEAIGAFLDAVLSQTRRPDEIVIVDAGSDDGTVERIRERMAQGADITLIVEPGASRSDGRNRGIRESAAEAIAVTDAGCLPRPDWFERIIAPLEQDTGVDVVAGYYVAEPEGLWGRAVAAATVPSPEEVDPARFLPSARSVAFRRQTWERVGGYPAGGQFGEDTWFGLALRRAGARFAFEPRALVSWCPETDARRLFRQFVRYARGDARERQWFRHYAKAYLLAVAAFGIIVLASFWPRAWLGLGIVAVAYWLRHAVRAIRRTPSLCAGLLAPLANLIVDFAHVVGYTRGLLERRGV